MHSTLVWAICNKEASIEGIAQLVKPHVRPQELGEFFWKHLEKDVELLGEALGKGLDEASLVVHLVLMTIATRFHNEGDCSS